MHPADFESEMAQAQRILLFAGFYIVRTASDTVSDLPAVNIDGIEYTRQTGLSDWLEAADSMLTAETPKTTERLLKDAYSRMVGGMFWLVATTKEAQDLKEKTKSTIREIENHLDMPDADRWYDPSETTVPEHTRRYVVWNDSGTHGRMVLLVGYCPDTLDYFRALFDDAKRAVPEVREADATCGKVTSSKSVKSFTLMVVKIDGPKREIDRYTPATWKSLEIDGY